MITYEPLWETLKSKGKSTYWMICCGVSRGTIHCLKHDRPITTRTLNDLCNLIRCDVKDVLKYSPDEENECYYHVKDK